MKKYDKESSTEIDTETNKQEDNILWLESR